MKDICFIGLGYVGLPTAIIAAKKGNFNILGVDTNKEIVDKTNNGQLHIEESGLETILQETIKSGKLKVSLKPNVCDTYIITVPTPFKSNHEPDISYVESATRSIIPLLKNGDLFIIESTSPVGTVDNMAKIIFKERPELKGNIFMAYCPERILPGNVIYELTHNDRTIGGINEASSDKAIEFYSAFVDGIFYKTNTHTAEMCKLVENASRDVNIAFANELSIICDKAGIDIYELITLANKHPRVNILQPGCGVGGHCIAVDPYFITYNFPKESKLIATARKVNDYKALWCAEKIKKTILKFKDSHNRIPSVAMMGLSYKPDIDDLRESPAKFIVSNIIQDYNNADIMIVEPNLKSHNIYNLTNYKEAWKKADIVIFLVAHKEFKTLKNKKNKVILDFCHINAI